MGQEERLTQLALPIIDVYGFAPSGVRFFDTSTSFAIVLILC
jgi:hypothetical protein